MSPSRVLLFSSVSFVLGIIVASFFKIPPSFYFFFFFFFLISLPYFFFSKDEKAVIFLLFFILFFIGILHYQIQFLQLEKAKNSLFEREKIDILGTVSSLPTKKEKFQSIIVKIQELNGKSFFLSGKILIKTSLSQQFKMGDQLKVSGKISKTKNPPGFNYEEYLLKDKILGILYFPQIEKTGKNFANSFTVSLFSFKEKLKQNIEKIFPLPHSGIIEALLFGEEEKIPDDLKEKFNITGTRHIAAVSGMNVTLLAILILNLFLTIGFWRKHAFFITLIGLFVYVFAIGFPSSAIRAAIMGSLFLIAQYFGRTTSLHRVVYLTLGLMLLINPLLLRYDVGFQLSFLATFGLCYLYPIFLEIFKDAPKLFGLKENLSATLSAQLFVFPLLLYNFGKFSPIFIFSNILILPVLPLATVFGFLTSFLAIFYFPLGKFFSYSALLFTNYIIKVVEFFSQFPYFSFKNFSLSFLIFSYFLLALFTFLLNKKFSQPFFLR